MLIYCLDVCGQGQFKNHFKLGFKLGMGMHTITGSTTITLPRAGLMGGMWFQIKMSKSWTMQSELIYSYKGNGKFDSNHPKNGDYLLTLSYYEVPILFQYNKKKVYFEFGVGLATLSGAGEIVIGGVLPYNPDYYTISKVDFTFNIGTGYVFNDKWRTGLRLTNSLIPVRKQLPKASMPGYNIGLVFSVSRQLNLKGTRNKQTEDGQ
ncbi:MAG: PorT family protein [Bacteroidetes bacterium]|nr:PorT family protein [Bacteroidota bacterium]